MQVKQGGDSAILSTFIRDRQTDRDRETDGQTEIERQRKRDREGVAGWYI